MGNYKDFEYEFITRTLNVLSQYHEMLPNYEFKHQYNHTLLINCLLGIIVMPKERIISRLSNDRITNDVKSQMGIKASQFKESITTIKGLIIALRHTIAHFEIEIISNSEEFLVDEVVFKDSVDGQSIEIARFASAELLPFTRYIGEWIKDNIVKSTR